MFLYMKLSVPRSRVRHRSVVVCLVVCGASFCDVSDASICFASLSDYDTRCYFNVHSKADVSQLNLPHGNNNY